MSALMMFRKCEHCGHRYMYNPSTGDFGLVCPKCKKAQSAIVPSQSPTGEESIGSPCLEKVIDFVREVTGRKQ